MTTVLQPLFDDARLAETLVPSDPIRALLLHAAETGQDRNKRVMMAQIWAFYAYTQRQAKELDRVNLLSKQDKEEIRKNLQLSFNEGKFLRDKLREVDNPDYTGAFIKAIEGSTLPHAKSIAHDMQQIARLGGISPSQATTPPQTPRQAPPPPLPTPKPDQPVTPKAKVETEEQRSFNELLDAWIKNVMAWLREANAKLDRHLDTIAWQSSGKKPAAHAFGTPAIAGQNG
jgi:hypothetical protein